MHVPVWICLACTAVAFLLGTWLGTYIERALLAEHNARGKIEIYVPTDNRLVSLADDASEHEPTTELRAKK